MQILLIFQTIFFMLCEIFWPLALGFLLSAIIQALVSHRQMASALGKDTPKCFTLATLFGAASSSCSYAAVALARSIFRKGATFTNSMIFELASTNLVFELAIVLLVFLGWQFALAEFLGGILMVVIVSFIFKISLSEQMTENARKQSGEGLVGKMEGHAEMDMSLSGGKLFSKLFSKQVMTSVSHYFVADVYSIWQDIVLGLVIAGVLAVLVPHSFWQVFFFTNDPKISFIEGPLVGPLVAIVSFVCSVGNIPLAAVLWAGGISFGGVVSFIFADLIILPILNIYRKYYGTKVMLYILGAFYATMVLAGYLVEIIFSYLNLIPVKRSLSVFAQGIQLNYTSILDVIFIIISLMLLARFLRTGGPMMLRHMEHSGHS